MGIFFRWLCAFILLALTFNPTPYNYVAWARSNGQEQLPFAVLIGLVLLVFYIVYLRATLRSIGVLGAILVAGLVGALLWVFVDLGVLKLDNPDVTVWLGIFALSIVLGIGLSWSIVRRRLSGQADVDDVDE